MIALVGYTGFVGSNICAVAGKEIEAVYNSKNIEEAFGTCPDLLIYAGSGQRSIWQTARRNRIWS